MKPLFMGDDHSGIDVTFIRSRMSLEIGGWYDQFVGIETTVMPLREFFDRVGIREADCRRAFKAERTQ